MITPCPQLDQAALIGRVARRLVRRLPASVDIRDLIQAAWVRLLRLRPDVPAARSDAHQQHHLAAHIRGAMLDELRAIDRPLREAMASASDDTDAQLAAMPCQGEQPQQVAERRESLRVLLRAVDALPPKLRLVMRDQLGQVPAADTAARLGVDAARVSQLRVQALRLLRLRLAVPLGLR